MSLVQAGYMYYVPVTSFVYENNAARIACMHVIPTTDADDVTLPINEVLIMSTPLEEEEDLSFFVRHQIKIIVCHIIQYH